MAHTNKMKKKSYETIVEDHPEFEGVIHKNSWDFIGISDKGTVSHLNHLWVSNSRKNVANKLWKKHGAIHGNCTGIGANKAVIAVGAGQSFNTNKHVLKQLHDFDSRKDWAERDFIIVSSNHQFKPLLKMGIIPDFVMLADASDVTKDQLTKDIPKEAQGCILLAGIHCSPKLLRTWNAQGRDIKFYLTHSEGLPEVFKETTGLKPEPFIILQGGNVLNSTWSIGLKHFGSSVFMALGNDLSFPLSEDVEKKRDKYYADGDYSTNTGTGRDEANSTKQWMGFKIKDSIAYGPSGLHKGHDIELDYVGTTYTLWVYKTWLEANVLGNNNMGKPYHYFNCSEGGIAGVMCKKDTKKGLELKKNWFMMDDVCKRWKTMRLEDAAAQFIKTKDMMKWQNQNPKNMHVLHAAVN